MDDKGHLTFEWTRDYLQQVLTTGKNPVLKSENLIEAFERVDRADFLPEAVLAQAYTDADLEFAFGEKINSPVLVGRMLQALEIKPGQKIMELGTGAGYTLALLALAVAPGGYVYSIERNQQISSIARSNLVKYRDISNYEIIFKDGSAGLVTKAPYDAIHVTFAYEEVPEELLLQLKIGGRLVTPLTSTEIKLFERQSETEFAEDIITAQHFGKLRSGVE